MYSKFEFQDMFLRYLLEGETEKLFFCLLTRTFNFQKILNGELDLLPEQAFYLVGGIEMVYEKAKKLSEGK